MFRTEFSVTPTASHTTDTCPNSERLWIALLHGKQSPHGQTLRVLTALGASSVCVTVWESAASAATFASFDLILYEAVGIASGEMQTALHQLRMHSKAPLVAFTSVVQSELTLLALRAGADAVIPLTQRQDIITAHCLALIRRWQQAHSHACAASA
jgi:DNA-binding response OmpR family regulator